MTKLRTIKQQEMKNQMAQAGRVADLLGLRDEKTGSSECRRAEGILGEGNAQRPYRVSG